MSFALQVTVIGATGVEVAKGLLTDPAPTYDEAYALQTKMWNEGVGSLTFKDGQQVFIVGADLVAQSAVKLEIIEA